jgi:hypothetical protein
VKYKLTNSFIIYTIQVVQLRDIVMFFHRKPVPLSDRFQDTLQKKVWEHGPVILRRYPEGATIGTLDTIKTAHRRWFAATCDCCGKKVVQVQVPVTLVGESNTIMCEVTVCPTKAEPRYFD